VSKKDGVVHLWNLPKTSVCVKLSPEIQRLMIETALRISENGPKKLANILKVNVTTIYDFKKSRFKSVTLDFVIKLSNFLERNGFKRFSLENIEKNLKLIKTKWIGKTIHNPKFPMNFNNESGARVISAIFFDGGITSNCRPFYTNNEEFLVNQILEDIKSIIGEIEFYERKDGYTFDLEFPKILGLIFINGLELIPGAKVFNNPEIPEFITNNKNLYKPFLQQAFDDEGYVHLGKSGKSINLDQYHTQNEPPTRLLQIKEMLQKFRISVNGPFGPTKIYNAKKGYTSYGWSIQISNQSDIRVFQEKINFTLERKRQKLEKLLTSYKIPPRFKKGIKYQEVLKVCKKLKAEGKKISIKNIANKLNRKPKYVAELTLNMTEKGMLTVTKEKTVKKGFGSGFSEKEFELVV